MNAPNPDGRAMTPETARIRAAYRAAHDSADSGLDLLMTTLPTGSDDPVLAMDSVVVLCHLEAARDDLRKALDSLRRLRSRHDSIAR